MDVTRARRLDSSHLRCPYCRDELEAEPERVECPGCATVHHLVCLEELGRCSVMGCGAVPALESPRPDESPQRRQVRQRIRERVQRIARDLFTPVTRTPPRPRWSEEPEFGPEASLADLAADAITGVRHDLWRYHRPLLLIFGVLAAIAGVGYLAIIITGS